MGSETTKRNSWVSKTQKISPFDPGVLGSLPLKNRVIKAATYEGKTPDGVPSDALYKFHSDVVRGGVAMTTIGYCTTEADGRINDQMMWLREEVREPLREVVGKLKNDAPDVKVSGQMTHCGNFSKLPRRSRVRPLRGPSRAFNMLGVGAGTPLSSAMSVPDIDRLVDSYRRAALFMQNVGFDAIEIHFGHGYGLSQFISPKTNKRKDQYGGVIANRMRLPLRVLEAVKSAVGDSMPIIGKINMTDGVKDGIALPEAVEVAGLLDRGGIDALICSGGTSSFNPMVYFRGESMATGLIEQQTNPIMKTGLKLISKRLFKQYPYEELFFLEDAKRVRDRVSCQMIYVGGCTEVSSLHRLIAEGFDFVQLARPLVKDPNYVLNAMQDANYKNGCIHCNRCATLIDAPGGVRCPLND